MKIEKIDAALYVCREIERQNVNINSLNTAYYLELFNKKETTNRDFIEICKDYLQFELNLFGRIFKNVFNKNQEKYGLKWALIIVFIICLLRGIASHFIWKESFFKGFLSPFVLFAAASAVLLPIYILCKKAPKTAAIVTSIILFAAVVFIAILIILIIIGIIGLLF